MYFSIVFSMYISRSSNPSLLHLKQDTTQSCIGSGDFSIVKSSQEGGNLIKRFLLCSVQVLLRSTAVVDEPLAMQRLSVKLYTGVCQSVACKWALLLVHESQGLRVII